MGTGLGLFGSQQGHIWIGVMMTSQTFDDCVLVARRYSPFPRLDDGF
jgi:hypothetical protein